MDQSEIANDHNVRMIEVNEDDEAIIRVRTKFHVSLVFSRSTIEIFEKDGVIYTRQESNEVTAEDTQSEGEEEYASELETQPFDWVDQFTYKTPDDPPPVVDMMGGNFREVNEKHASRLEEGIEGESLAFEEVGDSQQEEIPSYLQGGETQLDIVASQTESEANEGGYTQMRYQEMEFFGFLSHDGHVIAIADTQSP